MAISVSLLAYDWSTDSLSVTVPSGTQALVFFSSNEDDTGTPPTVNTLGDGSQTATRPTGAATARGSGPSNSIEALVCAAPTIGTSTWTRTWVSGTPTRNRFLAALGISGIDTGAIVNAVAASNAGSSPISTSIVTTVAGCEILGLVVHDAHSDDFTAQDAQSTLLNSTFLNEPGGGAPTGRILISQVSAPTATTYDLGWTNSGTVTRLLQVLVALTPGTITSPHVIDTPGSGTFTAPDTASYLIETWGAGAGGAGYDTTGGSEKGGPGGGGGAYSAVYVSLTAAEECDYTVGAAGTGGVEDALGTDGGDTSFENPSASVIALAKGGDRAPDWTTEGAGGLASAGTGTTKYDGGDSCIGIDAGGGDLYGGSGGSSAGTASHGTDATDETGTTAPTGGGDGGKGAGILADPPAAGTAPGGGGGGGSISGDGSGAAGAPGRIRITWPASPPSGFQPAWAKQANQFAQSFLRAA